MKIKTSKGVKLGSKRGPYTKKKRVRAEENNKGRWSSEEEIAYLKFLDQHKSLVSSHEMRKSLKVFEQMARFMGYRRTPDQCRSHHQKMQLLRRQDRANYSVK